jgi:hypothetical protein
VTRAQAAVAAFGAVLVAGLVLYLVVGREQWFFADDWEFIAGRSLANPLDLFRPYNGHWILLPIIIVRGLFSVFHLSTYLPYQLPVILLQLASAWLLRVIMRRAGVGPWTATAAATAIVLLGSTYESIIFAAQISYLGALVLGLGQLVLADHDGAIGRRDWLALGLGLCALMCSSVSIVPIGATALAVLLRRGWRPALLQAAPLAAIYLTWSRLFGDASIRSGGFVEATRFVVIGLEAGLRTLGQVPGAAVIISATLLVGLVIAARGVGLRALVSRQSMSSNAVTLALLVGAVAFMVVTALGRAGPFGAESAASLRYAGVVAFFVLPALALAVTTIRQRYPRIGTVALALLVMGIPGNVLALRDLDARATTIAMARAIIVALPELPGAESAPDDMKPLPESGYAPAITMGFLRTATNEGWLPRPETVGSATAAIGTFHLALRQHFADTTASDCTPLTEPLTIRVVPGDVLLLAGGFVTIAEVSPEASPLANAYYNPNRGNAIEVLEGDMTLQLSSQGTNGAGEFCK